MAEQFMGRSSKGARFEGGGHDRSNKKFLAEKGFHRLGVERLGSAGSVLVDSWEVNKFCKRMGGGTPGLEAVFKNGFFAHQERKIFGWDLKAIFRDIPAVWGEGKKRTEAVLFGYTRRKKGRKSPHETLLQPGNWAAKSQYQGHKRRSQWEICKCP